MKKSKKQIFNKENVRVIEDAVSRRFGGLAGVNIKEEGGLFRVTEKNPASFKMHVATEFSERDEKGEKLTGLSFSSEMPVMRFGEPEILLHDSGAADFSRLLSVGAILKNHDPENIIGVPVMAWIDDKKRGNLAMRWGTTDGALKAKQEALTDKTLRGVSVGYSVREWVYLKNATETYKGISGPAWVAVKWDALEASLTPIPADPSVGLERSIRVCAPAQVVRQNKNKESKTMKKLKLLRAWKASDGKSYDAGVELEVDERTFTELTSGDEPQAEAVVDSPEIRAIETSKREVKPETIDIQKQIRDAIVAETRAEQKRANDIRAVCKRFALSEMADELVVSGKTVEEAQRLVLDKLAERHISPVQGSIIMTQDGHDSFRSAAVDGMLLRSGVVEVAKPVSGADEFRGKSLLRIAEECLIRAGRKVPSDIRKLVDLALGMRGSETIASDSTDFPLILAAGANKSLLAGYESAPATFPYWALVGSINDFKATKRLKFSNVGKLRLVAEKSKYEETAMSESGETIQLGTYARMWTMSRQGIINDDLGAFTQTLFKFGSQARMLPNDLGMAVLNANAAMTDGHALFSTDHGNYSHVTAQRLDTLADATAALRAMFILMAKQTAMQGAGEVGADGSRYLNLRPKTWLVAMSDLLIARQVINSTSDVSVTNAGVQNAFAGLGINVVGDQAIMTSGTDYKHILFADPRIAPVVEVAFLQGNQAPYFSELDQTNADGSVWLVRLDCGAAAVDYCGAVEEVGTT